MGTEDIEAALWLVAAVVTAVGAYKALLRKTVVSEAHVGLYYYNGRFARVLMPGRYWHLRTPSKVDMVDMRKRVVTVPGQEVLTADNVGVKLSVAVTYEVEDAAQAAHAVQDYAAALYTSVQLALRTAVASTTAEDLLQKRLDVTETMSPPVAQDAAAIGLRVHKLAIKDVMFPGALKQIFAEVVRAKQEGLAALERARGETAALRNLANASRLLDNNPALMNLRVLQSVTAAGSAPGNTLVIGVPPGMLVPAASTDDARSNPSKPGPTAPNTTPPGGAA